MSDDHAHPDTADATGHDDAAKDGDDEHASDGHGHGAAAEPLGPVDGRAWAAAIGGSLLAVVLVVALYLTISS